MKKILSKIIDKFFDTERKQNIFIPILAILISLLVGGIIIILVGKNPLTSYHGLLQGAGILPKATYANNKGMLTDFSSMINMLTPMIFAALAVAVAFKCGLFNIGVSGQMLLAGFIATILVGYSETNNFFTGGAVPINPILAKILVVIVGMLAGGMVGAFIGLLKDKFNINEVVSSIMINYIIMNVSSFFIHTKYIDPISRQSKNISEASRLTLIGKNIGGVNVDLPIGIILALVTVFFIWFLLNKTRVGFEIKSVGSNKSAAKYAGINVSKNIILTMFISGALAGIAGVFYYLGYFSNIRPKVLPSMGFDSIAVSLLGNSNPIAIIFSSFLITVIGSGSTYMSSVAKIPQEISSVITGVILLFSACSSYFKYLINRHLEFKNENSSDKKDGDN